MPPNAPRLRAQLQRLLALSLATPLSSLAVTACRAGDEAPPVVDAGTCGAIDVDAAAFDDGGRCGRYVYLPCGLPAGTEIGANCNPSSDLCTAVCPDEFFYVCQFAPSTCANGALVRDASVYLDCSVCIGNIGRRPAGLGRCVPGARRGASPVGRYLALAAYLEGASVVAFHELGARLEAFGAPLPLQRAARRAARDETRHAKVTAALARRHGGGEPASPAWSPAAALTFEQLVTENAVEGCVRETYGALVSLHQAVRAEDPRVARAMCRISEEETQHAELAWAIHRWGCARLSGTARGRVRAAQVGALAELRASAGSWPLEVTRTLGLPAPSSEAAIIEAFGRSVLRAPRRRSAARAKKNP